MFFLTAIEATLCKGAIRGRALRKEQVLNLRVLYISFRKQTFWLHNQQKCSSDTNSLTHVSKPHVQGSDMRQRFLLVLVEFRQVFSVLQLELLLAVCRVLIFPNPLVVSLWKHILSLLHMSASDHRHDWLWGGDELWWSTLDRVTWHWTGKSRT